MSEGFPLDTTALLEVLNYLNDGVYITDRDRRIVLWNKKAEEITGYQASQVVGSRCSDNILNHVDKHGNQLCGSGLCPLNRAIVTGKASTEPIVVYAKNARGSRIAVSVSVAPLNDARGDVIGGIEVFRDETARMHDLEFARRIQQHILPRALPASAQVAFDVRYYTREMVGGDFYEVEEFGDGDFSFFVGDVRGHGVSASLYTMQLKLLSSICPAAKTEPGWHMSWLNQRLCELTLGESFVTGFYGIIEVESQRLSYANAAHPPPLVLECQTGVAKELEEGDLLLGVDASETYRQFSLRLAPPCLLLCYTDGAVEIENRQGEQLGREGLKRMLQELDFESPTPALDELHQMLWAYNGNVEFADDVLLFSCWVGE